MPFWAASEGAVSAESRPPAVEMANPPVHISREGARIDKRLQNQRTLDSVTMCVI